MYVSRIYLFCMWCWLLDKPGRLCMFILEAYRSHKILQNLFHTGVILRPGFIYGTRQVGSMKIPLGLIGSPLEMVHPIIFPFVMWMETKTWNDMVMCSAGAPACQTTQSPPTCWSSLNTSSECYRSCEGSSKSCKWSSISSRHSGRTWHSALQWAKVTCFLLLFCGFQFTLVFFHIKILVLSE